MPDNKTVEGAAEDSAGSASRWKKKINAALKVEKTWRKDAEKIISRYREEDVRRQLQIESEASGPSRFNILYANISVLRPSIFQNAPRPDVRRRYDPEVKEDGSDDPIREASRKASTILERSLTYSIDDGQLEAEALDSISDMLLPGRGWLRMRYQPDTVDEPVNDELGHPLLDDDGKPQMTSRIIDQRVWLEHAYWADVLVDPVRRWSRNDQPGWIAFRHLMTRGDLKKAFKGPVANKIGLTWRSSAADNETDRNRLGESDRAEVWEIWDGSARRVIWIAMGFQEIIEDNEDLLGLRDFYPCPRPLYSVRTTDTLVPVSEYKVYADLAAELDEVQERITTLTSQLKAVAAYDGTIEGLEELLKEDDGMMVPIKGFEITEGRKLEDSVMWLPLEGIIGVLTQLYQQRESIKQTIFEVIGISDILRGSSDPSETLGAQRIKTQFGTLRIDERRREVDRILRDGMRLMAECIAEKFEPETLRRMTGIDIDDAALEILRDEGLRGFLVDIETDSTVAPDETAEQESVTKLLQGVTQFLAGMAPLVQDGMLTGKQVLQILRFAIRPFRGARNLEEVMDEAERTLEAAEKNPQPGGDDAEGQEKQLDVEIKKIELQIKQLDAQTAQAVAQADIQKAQLEIEKEEARTRNIKAQGENQNAAAQ